MYREMEITVIIKKKEKKKKILVQPTKPLTRIQKKKKYVDLDLLILFSDHLEEGSLWLRDSADLRNRYIRNITLTLLTADADT